jgi:DNA-binding MarR family transcriptional regulator
MQLYCNMIEIATTLAYNAVMADTEDTSTTWSLFLRTHAVLVEKIEARLKEEGLPALSWYDVLWALESAPRRRLRMHELARGVVLSRSNLTRLVDRLEEAGLARRESSEDDGRGAHAAITAKGLAMRKKMWPTYRACIEDLFNRRIPAATRAAMQKAFRSVLESEAKGG